MRLLFGQYFTSRFRIIIIKPLSLPTPLAKKDPMAKVCKYHSSALKQVKIFGSTSISGYTDRVDEICAWLEAWLLTSRSAWDDLPSQKKLSMFTSYPPKKEKHVTPQLVYPFGSTFFLFVLGGFVLHVYFQIWTE